MTKKPPTDAQLNYLLSLANKANGTSYGYLSQVPELKKRFNACVRPSAQEVSSMIDAYRKGAKP